MKKVMMICLATAIVFAAVGCAAQDVPETDATPEHETKQDVEQGGSDAESEQEMAKEDGILIQGIVSEIKEGMITLVDVQGLEAYTTLVLLIGEQTQFDVNLDLIGIGGVLKAQVSMKMTRSIPPQSPALRIISYNDIILGEVLEITDTNMRIRPISDFFNHEEVVINFGDETVWNDLQGAISAGHHVRVVVDNVMTMSIPPQVGAVEILSIETRD